MKNPKITLQDVAKRAGMSAATASRALRGLSVHKKYQGKAQIAAQQLGYVVNEAARALRSERTMTVGMVYHDLTSLLGMELLRAMAAGLEEDGYSLFVSTAQGKNDHFDRLVQRFLQRRVDALVCVHANGDGAALQGYLTAKIPVMALISQAGGYAKLPIVKPSVEDAASDCIVRLRELGHRSICVFAPNRAALPIDDFIAVAKVKRMKLRQEISNADFDAKVAFRKLFSQDNRPTAVVALQQDAVKLLDAAKGLKVQVPNDLSIVAVRDRTQATSALPLSTLHLHSQRMGAAAADTLRKWLSDGVPLKQVRLVQMGEWVERETTGPAPK